MGQFGDKFRKAREKKGISLDDASNVTKIGSRMLQAIEEEHFDQLPGGVFNKGFIRAYAKHLGINDQEAVSEYLDCLRQEQVKAQAVWEPQARPVPEKRPVLPPSPKIAKPPVSTRGEDLPELQLPKAEHVRPPRNKYLRPRESAIPWRLIAATAVVLVLAMVLWRRHSTGGAASSASASGPVALPATSTSSPAAPNSAAPTSTGTPAAGTPAAVRSSSVAPASPARIPNTPVVSTSPAPPKPSTPGDGDENDVVTTSPSGSASATPANPAPALTLVIRATENSWISVQADGQSVSRETLIAPAHTSVRANREIVARIGNAAGVVFLWNGKEIPADGAEAEVKTFVFDAQGMRVVATSPPASQNP